MSEWEFDPEEYERQQAQGGKKPEKPGKPVPAPSTPAPAKAAAAKTVDPDFDFMDLPGSTAPASSPVSTESTPLLNDEAREKVAAAAAKAKAATGELAVKATAHSKILWFRLVAWFHEFQAKRASAAAAASIKSADQEKNRRAAVAKEKKEGMRAPLVLDSEELPHTPRVRTELFRGPNTKVYTVLAVAIVALCLWAFRDSIPFLSSLGETKMETVDAPVATPDAPMMPAPVAPRLDPEQVRRDAEAARLKEQQAAQAERDRLAAEQRVLDEEAARVAAENREYERQAAEAARARVETVAEQPKATVAPVVRATPAKPRAAPRPKVETSDEEEARMMKEQMEKLDAWGKTNR